LGEEVDYDVIMTNDGTLNGLQWSLIEGVFNGS
jgi:hypothetical protein